MWSGGREGKGMGGEEEWRVEGEELEWRGRGEEGTGGEVVRSRGVPLMRRPSCSLGASCHCRPLLPLLPILLLLLYVQAVLLLPSKNHPKSWEASVADQSPCSRSQTSPRRSHRRG